METCSLCVSASALEGLKLVFLCPRAASTRDLSMAPRIRTDNIANREQGKEKAPLSCEALSVSGMGQPPGRDVHLTPAAQEVRAGAIWVVFSRKS